MKPFQKVILLFAVLALMLVAAAPMIVRADGGSSNPGNSQPGIGRYLDNQGRQQATEVGAQCGSGAGSGAFGYFGKDLNMAGGANGYQTGLNNSAVCGNRP